MAWTTPGTATAGEVYTAAFYNEQTRDNLAYLKAEADAVGLVHITTVTISASSAAVSVNDVFTSAYRNYRVVFDFETSGTSQCTLRMRVAGSDASGAGTYLWSRYYWVLTTAPTNNGGSNADNKGVLFTETDSGRGVVASFDVYKPALAQETFWVGHGAYSALYEGAGILHDVSTAYDGFTFDPAANITGKLSVYGYREA